MLTQSKHPLSQSLSLENLLNSTASPIQPLTSNATQLPSPLEKLLWLSWHSKFSPEYSLMDCIAFLVSTYCSCNVAFICSILRLFSSQLTVISLKTWSQGSCFVSLTLYPKAIQTNLQSTHSYKETYQDPSWLHSFPISYLLLNDLMWSIIISDPQFQPQNHNLLSSFLQSLNPLLPYPLLILQVASFWFVYFHSLFTSLYVWSFSESLPNFSVFITNLSQIYFSSRKLVT